MKMGSILPTSTSTSIQAATATPQCLVIGAGSRGTAYARAITKSGQGVVAAVAETDAFKRNDFGRRYVWRGRDARAGQAFEGWREFVVWEMERRRRDHTPDSGNVDDVNGNTKNINDDEKEICITTVFVCTLDQTHVEIICALAPLNLHILCEKPLALTLADCLTISRALSAHPPKIFSIGHVLRYSPHNMLLRRLVCDDQIVGEVVSVEHTEPVGYWHFAHSYVRGNWRRSHGDEGVGSLLTKSCHDIDFVLWLLCSPSPLTGPTPHLPSTISSHGALTHFRRARKPAAAGPATNCLDCPAEPDCVYSAKRIYRDKFLRGAKDTGWPVKIVVPEIEDVVHTAGWDKAEERLLAALGEDYDATTTSDDQIARRSWYGRCVYEADNEVVDEQSVTIAWDEDVSAITNGDGKPTTFGRGPKQAVFHMTYPTQAQCDRRGRIYGTLGEIEYDSSRITVFTFADNKTVVHETNESDEDVRKSHGGGDAGLAGMFVQAVRAVESGVMGVAEAQRAFVGCDLEECFRSHAAVFAAEEARVQRRVVHWAEWWDRRVGQIHR